MLQSGVPLVKPESKQNKTKQKLHAKKSPQNPNHQSLSTYLIL